MLEHLDGMSSEQLMLCDVIYELYDLLDEASKDPNSSFRMGVYSVVKVLSDQMKAFEIDQSKYPRPMPDVDAWLAGKPI
jgi:hypothetical protein